MKTKKVAAFSAAAMVAAGAAFIPASFADGMITVPGLDEPIPAVDSTVPVESTALIDAGAATLDGKPLTCDTSGLKNNDYTTTCRYLDGGTPVATIAFVTKGSPDDVEPTDKPTDPAVTPKVRSITVDGQVVGLRQVSDGWEAEAEVDDPANIKVVADYVGGTWAEAGGSSAEHIFTFTPDNGDVIYYHIKALQKPVVRSVTVDGDKVAFTQDAKGHWTTSVEVVDPASMDVKATVAGGKWEPAGHDGDDYLYRFVADRGASVTYYHVIATKKTEEKPLSNQAWITNIVVDGHSVNRDEFKPSAEDPNVHNLVTIEVEDLDAITGAVESISGMGQLPDGPLGVTLGVGYKEYEYRATAEDGTQAVYVVKFVQKAVPSSQAWITNIVVDGHSVNRDEFKPSAEDPNVHNLVTIEVEDLDAITGAVEAVSGMGTLPSAPSATRTGESHKTFTYTVVAEDGSQADYVIDFVQKTATEPTDPTTEPTEPGASEQPAEESAKPAETPAKKAKKTKSLAKTGIAVAGLGGLAALLTGSGAFVVRRSRRED